eukprot:272059_1
MKFFNHKINFLLPLQILFIPTLFYNFTSLPEYNSTMKTILGIAALTAVALADEPSPADLNEIFAGTYEFEVMGRPHRLYICDTDRMAENKKALYWSVADRTANEYAVAVGRDYDGVEMDGDGVYVSRCDIFKLYGDRILKGYYEIIFDASELVFSLRERFPELENGQADEEIWNEYELVKLSPAIVGNPDLEGYQCMHPLGNVVYAIDLPSLFESDFSKLDDGYFSTLIEEDALTSCWKLENEFGDVMQAGWHYGYDFEWDGELLLFRFDSVNKNFGCSVGTIFIVIIDEGLAIVSRQCEDRVTGRTYIAHAQDMVKHEMCPYAVTPFDEHEEDMDMDMDMDTGGD